MAILAATALAILAGAAWASPGRVRTYAGGGIAFEYPAAWNAAPAAWRWHSNFVDSVTYLSSQPLHDPCARTTTSIRCGRPVGTLRPGAVLISWARGGFPGWTLADARGRATTVAGRASRLEIARPGACADASADETVTARISLARGTYVQMQACLRGPGRAAGERAVRAMLRSLRVRPR